MLKPENDPQIPEETAKVAKAAFPNGNIHLLLRDTLGAVFEEQLSKIYIPRWDSQRKARGDWH